MTDKTSSAEVLRSKLEDRSAEIAVLGLGYVGLPLVEALHRAGFQVLGFDLDEKKIEMLNAGQSYLSHLGEDLVPNICKSERFTATADASQLSRADAIILCVPSPLGQHREPDMQYILNSTRMVSEHLRPGQLVSLESTTYPGTTRGDCLPILLESGLEVGKDFFLAYSPEREDPGRSSHNTRSTPKLVGGVDPLSTELAVLLYSAAVEEAIPVDSAEVAEAAKLLENIYRAVNIALANELKPVLQSMGIDIWKVIGAAATKPFGFQAFYPGPGLGGHCIPIDPFYLTWKAREFGHHTKFIELAGQINSAMPEYVVERASFGLNEKGKAMRGAKVLVLGIAYKPNVDDIRETPAAEIIKQLQLRGAKVEYHDPHVPELFGMRKYTHDMSSVDLTEEKIRSSDCVLIVTDHKAVDYSLIAKHAELIVDTRNVMAAHMPVTGLLVPS